MAFYALAMVYVFHFLSLGRSRFALVLATPYAMWELWQFVVPGLHVQERRFVGPFVLVSSVAFYAGILFSFFFVLPFALNFLVS